MKKEETKQHRILSKANSLSHFIRMCGSQQKESHFLISTFHGRHMQRTYSVSCQLLCWTDYLALILRNQYTNTSTHTHSVALLSEYNKQANTMCSSNSYLLIHPSFLAHLHILHLNKSLCWRVSLSCKPLVWLKLILYYCTVRQKSINANVRVWECVISVHTTHCTVVPYNRAAAYKPHL